MSIVQLAAIGSAIVFLSGVGWTANQYNTRFDDHEQTNSEQDKNLKVINDWVAKKINDDERRRRCKEGEVSQEHWGKLCFDFPKKPATPTD